MHPTFTPIDLAPAALAWQISAMQPLQNRVVFLGNHWSDAKWHPPCACHGTGVSNSTVLTSFAPKDTQAGVVATPYISGLVFPPYLCCIVLGLFLSVLF